MDKKAFYNRYVFAAFTRLSTLLPSCVGITTAAILAAIGKVGLAFLCGGSGLLITLGIFVTRLILPSEKLVQQVQDEIREETNVSKRADLDELDAQLVQDRDSRTQKALRDLRVLADAIKGDNPWKKRFEATATYETLDFVDKIFDLSIETLRSTLELRATMRMLSSDSAKKKMQDQIEQRVQRVLSSVDQLNQTFADIQELALNTGGDPSVKLTRLGKELKSQFEVARATNERMSEIVQEYGLEEIL